MNWEDLQSWTQARIGLSRIGTSLSTKEKLQLRFDHAEAKDAVLQDLDWDSLQNEMHNLGLPEPVVVKSQAKSKEEYLLHPDLGRKLHEDSERQLRSLRGEFDVSLVCGDGLSATALKQNLIPFLAAFYSRIQDSGWNLAPIVWVQRARVAIADPIGEILGAKLSIMIIGERPGLTSADSLGSYITYGPKTGNTDESRNCISNIRPSGLKPQDAADKVIFMTKLALSKQISGVHLKDESDPFFLLEKESNRLTKNE